MSTLLQDVKVLEEAINYYNSFVLMCHVNADGDALGSTLGLRQLLINMGKKATVITPDLAPTHFAWMPGFKTLLSYERMTEQSQKAIDEADCLFFMDYNDHKRTNSLGEYIEKILPDSNKFTVLVDHHLDPVIKAHIMFSYPDQAATCSVMYQVCSAGNMHKYVDKDVATCFYTGIITDTGGLSYNSCDPLLYILVSELLGKGIDKITIHDNIFNSKCMRRLHLQGYALGRKTYRLKGTPVAIMKLDAQELMKYQYNTGDTEGFVNIPLQAKEIKCCCFIMERPDGVKISLRSKGDFSVNEFAKRYYSGGGHLNASGATFNGSYEDCVASVEKNMVAYCKELGLLKL